MANDTPDPKALAIRKSALSIDHASSRLIKRGLVALDEACTVCLAVVHLIAFESSVFVLSDHWDREAYSRYTHGEKDPTWANRDVILYEFHRTGEYIGKVVLPLIRLSDEGYSLIQRRSPGKVIVRSEFIHFHENLQTTQFSKTVRIDYLFSRSGKRQAVWTNEPFVDRYRLATEPFVPCETALRPYWATSNTLIALQPYANNPAPHNESSFKHAVTFGEAMDFANAVANPCVHPHFHSGKLYSELAPDAETHRYVEFPVESRFIAHKTFQFGWMASASDPEGAWFLAYGPDGTTQIIWKMEFVDDEPRVSTFTIPDPYELTRQGILEILNDEGDTWMPPNGQDRALTAVEQAEEDEQVILAYDKLFSWRNDLIVSLDAYGISLLHQDGLLLLLRQKGQHLVVVKQVSPQAIHFESLLSKWKAMSEEDRDKSFETHLIYPSVEQPPSAELGHYAFSDGYLYSLCHYGNHADTIVVTHIDPDTVTWFRPDIPELDRLSVVL